MVVLLLVLGLVAVSAGMFGLGLGAPVKDTTFGAAVLVSASVAMTGGFILVGLAVAVTELRRVLQAGFRQMRLPPERFEAERGGRRMEPRIAAPAGQGTLARAGAPAPAPGGMTSGGTISGGMNGGTAGADTADVIPTRFDAPEIKERPRQPAREERPAPEPGPSPSPFAPPLGESRRAPASPVSEKPALERPVLEWPAPERHAPARPVPEPAAPERFDTIRPADYRKLDQPEPHAGIPPAAGGENAPPPAPEPIGAAAIRPVRVIKSGTFNDVSYTLFSDGSIETQTAGGTQRFSSIDEFRRHLEQSA